MQDLPDPRKTILFLAFWEGQSHTEIAESTGLPLGTVKSHVRRGLIHIQQQLEGVRRELTLSSTTSQGSPSTPTTCPPTCSATSTAARSARRPSTPSPRPRALAGGEPAGGAPAARARPGDGARRRGTADAAATARSDPAARRPTRTRASVAASRRGWPASRRRSHSLAGLGLGRLTGETAPTPEAVDPDPGTVVAAADLTALDSDAARGVASAVETDDTLTLRVSAEELGDEDGVHEVWLINVDGKRMVAIGLLASGDEGQFEVPLGLIDEGYRIVDISVEPDDGDPTHSGVSLARGELA